METAQNIASILGEDPKKLEKDSLKIYLASRLKEIDSKIFIISKRYGISNIFEMDEKFKKGELNEDCLEEYQELDALEAQKDQILNALKQLA